MRSPRILARFGAAALVGALALVPAHGQDAPGPVKVTFQETKTDVTEVAVAIDPAVKIRIGHVGAMAFGLTYLFNAQQQNGDINGMLCCGDGAIRTMFKVDGAMVYPNIAVGTRPLPANLAGKARPGMQQVWGFGDLRITQWLEHVPSRPAKAGHNQEDADWQEPSHDYLRVAPSTDGDIYTGSSSKERSRSVRRVRSVSSWPEAR